jgi:hypothetical protein
VERVARYLAQYLGKSDDRVPGERRLRRSEGIVIPQERKRCFEPTVVQAAWRQRMISSIPLCL